MKKKLIVVLCITMLFCACSTKESMVEEIPEAVSLTEEEASELVNKHKEELESYKIQIDEVIEESKTEEPSVVKEEIKPKKKPKKKKKEQSKPESSPVVEEPSIIEEEPTIIESSHSNSSVVEEEATVESSVVEGGEKSVSEMTLEEKKKYWESINPPPTGKHLTKRGGVFNGASGKETYYNLKMTGVLKNIVYGTKWKGSLGLDPNEYPYWVRSDGAKMVGQYIMCAANLDIRPYGTILETSLGKAIVVDTGSFAKKNKTQVDIAVNW